MSSSTKAPKARSSISRWAPATKTEDAQRCARRVRRATDAPLLPKVLKRQPPPPTMEPTAAPGGKHQAKRRTYDGHTCWADHRAHAPGTSPRHIFMVRLSGMAGAGMCALEVSAPLQKIPRRAPQIADSAGRAAWQIMKLDFKLSSKASPQGPRRIRLDMLRVGFSDEAQHWRTRQNNALCNTTYTSRELATTA